MPILFAGHAFGWVSAQRATPDFIDESCAGPPAAEVDGFHLAEALREPLRKRPRQAQENYLMRDELLKLFDVLVQLDPDRLK